MQLILDTLVEEFELVLLSDYPTVWTESILRRSPFMGYFSKIVETAYVGPFESYDSLFAKLIKTPSFKPGSTIFVDWHSQRTKAAINAGLDATIFVDAARFYQDLGLWGIVPLLDLDKVRRLTGFP